jgi:Flp pilus assembly pilin Flp
MVIRKIKAQSIVEYLLVFGAIVLAVIFGAQQLGNSTKTQMTSASNVVTKVGTTLDTFSK